MVRTGSPVQSRPSAQEKVPDETFCIYPHDRQLKTHAWFLCWYHVEMVNAKKPRTPCLVCGKEPYGVDYKYCSNACQLEYQHIVFIKKWKAHEVTGLVSIGVVSLHVKRYLREKFGNKCCLCGWAEVNPKTRLVPVVADHIDGNWRNNVEENLRLLCPNCDSLTPTYAALNRGNGRKHRAVSNRAKEGRLFISRVRKSA